ncbi:MAG: glycosyltransferase family 4 protein [Synechococcaceae cyanobacterium RL_1_2]|nr:glycosyltransferase family 4 protein [Synechococcaceae cyanobacterium RL_1_2]
MQLNLPPVNSEFEREDYRVIDLARLNAQTNTTHQIKVKSSIIIDSVFFQLYKTGIARVWRSLLEHWANTDFASHIVVLDRGNTAPKINGIRYRTIANYDYNNTEQDREMLQQICDEEGADLFISSYYTTPIATPSVFMAYDMIPEVLGGDLTEPMWREKHRAIAHASSYIAISENTAKDINRFFPDVPLAKIQVAHCGVDPLFKPATEEEIRAFKYKYGINKPYFMLGSLGGYKNPELFFQAFAQLANRESFDLLTTGSGIYSLNNWRPYTAGCTFHGLQLEDEELRLAYAGAIALVYPSLYEGFGMPVAEAMACGCPVITTPNASLPEVGGEAVMYINDKDVNAMADALCEVQKPNVRNSLIGAGLGQVQKFSWATMADLVRDSLLSAINTTIAGEVNYLLCPDWEADEDELLGELAEIIGNLAAAHGANPEQFTEPINVIVEVSGLGVEDGNLALSSIAMNLMMEEELDLEAGIKFTFIEDYTLAQWEQLLPQLTAEISLIHGRTIAAIEETEANTVTIQGDGNNYVIFPDWTAEEEHLLGMIYSAIETLQEQVNLEDINLLVNITNAGSEEDASVAFSSIVMNLMMEGIELPESMGVNFVDFSSVQWQSLGDLLRDKITLPGEFLPDSLPIAQTELS